MSKTVKDILEKVGGTPLVEISSKLNKGGAKVLAKVEFFNPGAPYCAAVPEKGAAALLYLRYKHFGVP